MRSIKQAAQKNKLGKKLHMLRIMRRGRISGRDTYRESREISDMKTMIRAVHYFNAGSCVWKVCQVPYRVQSALFRRLSFRPCDIARGESRVCVAQPSPSSPRTFRCIHSHRSHFSSSSASPSSLDLACKRKYRSVTTFPPFFFLLLIQDDFGQTLINC